MVGMGKDNAEALQKEANREEHIVQGWPRCKSVKEENVIQ